MLNNKTKAVFITWTSFNPHSSLLSEAFNSKIYYIKNLINSRGILWKLFFLLDYIYKITRTIGIILKTHPNLVVMQNPPSIVPVVIVLLSYIKKYKTVVDSHNGAFEKPWKSIPFYRWSLRKADIVILHNKQIFKRMDQNDSYNGINFKILNSRLSEFADVKKENLIGEPYFLVVSTFSGDEPMDILLEGLRLFNKKNSDNILFKLTGNYNKSPLLYNGYKNDRNIEFLGFVSNEQYSRLIVSAFGVISLSTRDDVQQFALMESIGAGVPFISNDNLTNRALFENKMILIEITPENIAEGIELFLRDKRILDKNITELKNIILNKWEKDFSSIKSELNI